MEKKTPRDEQLAAVSQLLQSLPLAKGEKKRKGGDPRVYDVTVEKGI